MRASRSTRRASAGSIDLEGGKIDDLVLKGYHETIEQTEPADPASVAERRAQFLLGDDRLRQRRRRKDADARHGLDRRREDADADQPVTLTWDNGEGLVFKRVISVDDKYMFTVVDSVENKGAEPATLKPYALVLRHGKPNVAGYSVLHEGFVGVIGDGGVQEVTYAGIDKETGKTDTYSGAGGWLGFTDKYWASAIIPDQTEPIDARFSAAGTAQPEDYQADFVGPEKTIAPGAAVDDDDAHLRRRQGSRARSTITRPTSASRSSI